MPQSSDDGAVPAPVHPVQAGELPGLLAVDHVGVAVPDLDAAIAFHTGVLGLVLLHREENVDADVAEAMLGAAGDGAGTQLQLLAPISPESPIARFLERSGPGLQQLAYRVADVDEAARVLRSRGLRLLYDAARTGTRGSRINFVHPQDAGGVLVELVEPAAPPERV
jgi:methylmalonyl-CoA/ethylmalonyl-CoA epimerase